MGVLAVPGQQSAERAKTIGHAKEVKEAKRGDDGSIWSACSTRVDGVLGEGPALKR